MALPVGRRAEVRRASQTPASGQASYPIEYTPPVSGFPRARHRSLFLRYLSSPFSLPFAGAERSSSPARRTHQRSLIKISILIVRRLPSRADVLAGVRFHAHGARSRSSTQPLVFLLLVSPTRSSSSSLILFFFFFCASRC